MNSKKIAPENLVKGSFSKEDAREIINNLFGSKISFHKNRNFSNEIRFNQQDKHALRRAKELRESLDRCLAAIDSLPENGQLRINCLLQMEFVEEEKSNKVPYPILNPGIQVSILE